MEDSLTVRLDEVEQELIRLLSLRAHDLQVFSSRQDQLLQSHYHSLSAALQTAHTQMTKLNGVTTGGSSSGTKNAFKDEVNGRWNERQNLKKFWVYCEELQRQKSNDFIDNNHLDNTTATNTTTNANNDTQVYQTPLQNDSKVNISTASLTSLCDLSLD